MRSASWWMVWALALLVGCGGGALQEGAAAFEAGELDAAIAAWAPVAEEGRASGRLHFDLGNAWYRKGDLPRAIAHYRAAQRTRPRDAHVHHNLALARSELQGVPQPATAARGWLSAVTPGELGLLGLLLTALGSGLGVAWRRRPDRGLGAPALAAWGVGVVIAAVAADGAWQVRAQPVAVVVDAPTAVRDLARPDGETRFLLQPGAELRVVRDLGDFVLVQDGRDRRGWVSRAALLVADRAGPAPSLGDG